MVLTSLTRAETSCRTPLGSGTWALQQQQHMGGHLALQVHLQEHMGKSSAVKAPRASAPGTEALQQEHTLGATPLHDSSSAAGRHTSNFCFLIPKASESGMQALQQVQHMGGHSPPCLHCCRSTWVGTVL